MKLLYALFAFLCAIAILATIVAWFAACLGTFDSHPLHVWFIPDGYRYISIDRPGLIFRSIHHHPWPDLSPSQESAWIASHQSSRSLELPGLLLFTGEQLIKRQYTTNTGIILHYALLSFLLALLFSLIIFKLLRHIRADRQRSQHLCPTCGYDLRATPTRCPECGAPSATHVTP